MNISSGAPMSGPVDDRKDGLKSRRVSVTLIVLCAAVASLAWLQYRPTRAMTTGMEAVQQPASTGNATSKEVGSAGTAALEVPSERTGSQKSETEVNHDSKSADAEVQPSSPSNGFVVYLPFPDPQACQQDAHFNPANRDLTAHDLQALRTLMAAANEVLAKKQTELRLKTEEWAKVLIESGLADPDSSVRKLVLPEGSSRVAVFQGGQMHTATVSPGDNAVLDQLNADLAAFVTETHNDIRGYFQ